MVLFRYTRVHRDQRILQWIDSHTSLAFHHHEFWHITRLRPCLDIFGFMGGKWTIFDHNFSPLIFIPIKVHPNEIQLKWYDCITQRALKWFGCCRNGMEGYRQLGAVTSNISRQGLLSRIVKAKHEEEARVLLGQNSKGDKTTKLHAIDWWSSGPCFGGCTESKQNHLPVFAED